MNWFLDINAPIVLMLSSCVGDETRASNGLNSSTLSFDQRRKNLYRSLFDSTYVQLHYLAFDTVDL